MAARILKGPYLEMDVEKGVGEYFFDAVEQYADRIFQIDPEKDQSETYKRVKQRSVRLALYLRKIGIKRGDVVMPLCKIDVDDAIPALATLLLGATVSCLDMMLDHFDIKHCVDLVRPKIIIAVDERVELIERCLDELGFSTTKIMVIGGKSDKYPNMYDTENSCTEEEENSFEPVKVDPKKDPAFILFSSGTTNLPKGLIWSHWTVMQQGLIAKNWTKPTPWHMDFCMSWGLYWNVFIWTLGICMMKGKAIILMQNETPMEEFLEIIQKYQIRNAHFELARIYTALATPKELFEKFDVSCLKSIMFAGAPIDSDRILKIRKLFPHAKVFNSYGSTEIGSSITSWSYERCLTKDYDTKADSTGVPYYNLEIKVVDIHTGKPLGPNQQGEILVKSPNQALGLHNRPIPPECFDESGFFKTGDLGYYDEDDYFYVVDRIDEMFKYDSYKICPSVIENHLLKLPAIKEVAVTCVPHEEDQNQAIACVVLNNNNNCELTENDMDQFIMEHLGDIYRLHGGVKFVNALPKTPSGKIKRRKVFKGQKIPVEVDKGVGEHFFEMSDKYADKVFQIDPFTGQTETFREVKVKCIRLAIHLRKMGITREDVVMPLCKNNLDNIVPVFAALLLGVAVSSLHMQLDLHDIRHAIDMIRPKIIIAVDERIGLIEKALEELGIEAKIMVIGGKAKKYANMGDIVKKSVEGEDGFKPEKVDVDRDVSFILFSSGTTNLPKGVMWSHKSLMHSALIGKRAGCCSWTKEVTWNFNYGISWGLYWNVDIYTLAACFTRGIPQIPIGEDATADIFLRIVDTYRVTNAFITSFLVFGILNLPNAELKKYDTSSLKILVVGGSPVSPKNIVRLRELIPHAKIWKLYGTTEAGNGIFDWPYERTFTKEYDTKPDSCGEVFANIDVKIVDEDTKQPVGPNKTGEILIKSPNQMLGYYNRPTPPEIFHEEGFMKTGDMGYYDEDGFFYVVDRINEVFKYQSHRIFPTFIENFLISLPSISAAAVVGIPHDEDDYHPAACIVLNANHKISFDDIDDKVYKHLGDIYRLRGGIKIVDDLPKTPSGKIKRRAIREMFLQPAA